MRILSLLSLVAVPRTSWVHQTFHSSYRFYVWCDSRVWMPSILPSSIHAAIEISWRWWWPTLGEQATSLIQSRVEWKILETYARVAARRRRVKRYWLVYWWDLLMVGFLEGMQAWVPRWTSPDTYDLWRQFSQSRPKPLAGNHLSTQSRSGMTFSSRWSLKMYSSIIVESSWLTKLDHWWHFPIHAS
jgi:hypothetical protein